MKRIKYYTNDDGSLESNLMILNGEVIYVRIEGFTFSIMCGDYEIYTEDTVDLNVCKKKARAKLLELGVIIENELRSKI